MSNRPHRGGHPVAMRPPHMTRPFDHHSTMRRPPGPRGPLGGGGGRAPGGHPMRRFPPPPGPGHHVTYPPPRPGGYPDPRGARPPQFGVRHLLDRPAPVPGPPPHRPIGRHLLQTPPSNQANLPNGQIIEQSAQQQQQKLALEATADDQPGSTVPELPSAEPGDPPTTAAESNEAAAESDDVVSLFGGSDFGDAENLPNNNALNENGKENCKTEDAEAGEQADPPDSEPGQSDQQKPQNKDQTAASVGKPPDLRTELQGQQPVRRGGGLLPRPSQQQQQQKKQQQQQPPAAPRVLLQAPPPSSQPPAKRSRTLLEHEPPGRGRGAFRGRGGLNIGAAASPRTLLPNPPEVKPLLSDADNYLSLAPSPGGLLQKLAVSTAPVTLLPAPTAASIVPTSSGRPPLLSAPAGRTQVLPTPRQVEASSAGDVGRPALLPTASLASATPGADFSSTGIAAYPTETFGVGVGAGLTDASVAGASLLQLGIGAPGGRPRLLQQSLTVKTEAEMRAELTEAFKSQQFERGYELLKVARATYPHEFTDLVVYEVVEYCASKKEALEVCVLTARLISEPNVKLLELLADLAEKNPGQLRPLTDELWLVFNNVLTLQPDATAMMAFIRCFSSLKSWTKVWGAVDRFAPMQIIPIEGFIFCLEALVNGNASEFVNLGIGLLSNMDPQNLQQVGLELIERLWLRCALDGSTENVGRIEQIRAIFHLTPTQQSNFLNRIRVKVTELVMGNDFNALCRFFSSVSNLEVLSEFVIDAFHVAEDPQAKFELLSKAISDKYRSRNPAMEAFISQTAVRLLKKSVDRMQWSEALKLLRSLRSLNISLMKAVSATQPDMSEAHIANMAFQIYMRSQSYSTAASMLSAETSPIGIALRAVGEHASARFQLLHELCTACIAEGTLADASSALNAMMQHPVARSSELNKVYNDFLAACCDGTSDDLKLGVEIIPRAHQSSLVISATVLRMLLCASFKHGMKAQAKEYLLLGTKVGIYPVVSVSCPGPKTVQLQSDLSKEEIHVILTNLFVKLKKYLMESLQSRELDVIQECTIKLTALNVGTRDTKFLEAHKLQSTEQAVLQRASEILQTPNNFQSVVSTRFLSENGVSVLKLDGTMVYQCVYYVDEDV